MHRQIRSLHKQHGHSRRAFTVAELLVSIVIIGILIALLLPAVQRSREAARMATCRSHLRQIGIASHQYLDVHRRFPWYVSGGWLYSILPYAEQGALYNSLQHVPIHQRSQAIPRIPVYLCPDDSTDRHHDVSSYAVNHGLPAALGKFQGFVFEPVNAASVTDGLSQTAMFSEYTSNTVVQAFIIPKEVPPMELSRQQLEDFGTACQNAPQSQVPWSTGGDSNPVLSGPGGYNHIMPPLSPICLFTPHPANAHPPFSQHSGGANVLAADGSVHFVSSSIDRGAWLIIGTISGNDSPTW